MERLKQFCLQEIGKLKQQQKEHGELSQQFAHLENKLLQEKTQGRVIRKDDADVKELFRLGNLIGFEVKSQTETWSIYEAGVAAYEKVLKEIKKLNDE